MSEDLYHYKQTVIAQRQQLGKLKPVLPTEMSRTKSSMRSLDKVVTRLNQDFSVHECDARAMMTPCNPWMALMRAMDRDV